MENILNSISYKSEKMHWIARTLIYFVCALLLAVPFIMAFDFINVITFDNYMVTNLVSVVLLIGTSIIVIKLFEKSDVRSRLGFEKEFALKKYVKGYLIGTLLIVSSALPIILLFTLEYSLVSNIKFGTIALYFLFFIVQGASEEVLVRGLIFPVIAKGSRMIVALIITSALFAILHGLNPGVSIIGVANIFLAGLLFGYCVIYFDSLWQVCALHSAWNFIQGNILGFAVSGNNTPSIFTPEVIGEEVLTGGVFGIEGSIFSVIVLVITVVTLHILCVRKGINVFKKCN